MTSPAAALVTGIAGQDGAFLAELRLNKGYIICEMKRRSSELVGIDPRHFRLVEADVLVGDSSKSRAKLGWRNTIGFPDLMREMFDANVALIPGQTASSAEW